MTASVHYTETPHSDRNDLGNIRQLLPYLRKYLNRVVIALICLLLAKFANVGIPIALKGIVDQLSSPRSALVEVPIALLLGYGIMRLASSLFNELRDTVFARVRYGAMRQLSVELMQHLYHLSLRFHLDRKTGAISRDLERGTRSASAIMNYLTFNILPTLVEVTLISLFLLIYYNAIFCVIILATVIIYISYTLMVTQWRLHFRHSMNANDSKANSYAVDGLINYETVKYFGNDNYEIERYENTLTEWEHAAVKSQSSMSLLNFGQGTIIAIGVTLVMILAANEVATGIMTIGDLVLVNAYLLQLFIPLGFLGIIYRQTIYSLADMDLFFKLMGKKAEVTDSPNARELSITEGKVSFEHVNFHYNPDREILKDISFAIEPGQKLAIVGPSGSGKSTVVRLLFRFFDTSSGSISIDDQQIRTVAQQSLRKAVGIVPQDTVLFNESIYYNIAYGNPSANKEQIVNAAKTAHIDKFIDSLPDNYNTIVGERGLKLSGGEKQRVAIARVVLKNPKILVFDEATSALDSHSELAILQALNEVSRNHTTLVIAHRLSTIIDADSILVLDQGRIIEQGTHDHLIQQAGAYTRMWALQQEQRKNKLMT